jgi:two-component system response regulator FixJ
MIDFVAIVGDEATARKSTARRLLSAGYHVALYESGSAFLDAVDAQPPRCIVLASKTPGCSSFEVLQALREKGMTVPIVVLTADGSRASMDRAMALDAAAYLTKVDDDGDRLVNTVNALLRRG